MPLANRARSARIGAHLYFRLSTTVNSLSDYASCGLAKTRFPPATGVPALAGLLPPPADDEPPELQAASTPTVQQAVRAIAKADLGLMRTPGYLGRQDCREGG